MKHKCEKDKDIAIVNHIIKGVDIEKSNCDEIEHARVD